MEEEKKETKKDNIQHKIKEQTEKKINDILTQGVQAGNIDMLYKLVDIHKDIANEEYWKNKEEVMEMNYRDYGEDGYGRRGVPGTGRGRYRDGSYGRRGVPGSGRGRYRGNYAMDEMMENYENYNEANEESMRGNYGAEGEMVKSVEGIMKNIYEIVEELSDTEVPEVEKIIKRYAKKISEM